MKAAGSSMTTCESISICTNHERHMDEARVLLGTKDEDAEALFYLTDALRQLRPSIVIGLARVSHDTAHMVALLRIACMACAYPEMADGLAGEAVDGFHHGEEARADTAYSLIMLAVALRAQPDTEWKHIHSVTSSIAARLIGGAK
jgi:hypothetical protein